MQLNYLLAATESESGRFLEVIGLFNMDSEIYPEDDGSLKEDLASINNIHKELFMKCV